MSVLSHSGAFVPGRSARPTASVRVSSSQREVSLQGGAIRAFETLRRDPYPWLLDTALLQPGRGRYSFAGSDPYLVVRAFGRRIELECRRKVRPDLALGNQFIESDPLDALRALLPRTTPFAAASDLERPELPFVGGAVGYFGYELMVDPRGHLPFRGRDDLGLPDLVVLFVDRLLAYDHEDERAWVCGLGFGDVLEGAAADTVRGQQAERAAEALWARLTAATERRDAGADRPDREGRAPRPSSAYASRRRLLATPRPHALATEVDEGSYQKSVATIVDEIESGNLYQGNLTHRMDAPFSGETWPLYRRLRALNPAPFAAYLSLPEVDILSSSPERFLRATIAGELECCPFKGTRPRGSTPGADARLKEELAESSKDGAENLMIVDLVRNDLGRVCQLGSIEVPDLRIIEDYATVFQMVSRVTGRLEPDHDALDALRAAFPPGSMTGAPKIAAMRLLDRLEPTRRSVYSGAIGYLDVHGGADLAVVIRTLLVSEGRAYLHVGGGVVADSEPAAEYRESIDKARALWAALAVDSND